MPGPALQGRRSGQPGSFAPAARPVPERVGSRPVGGRESAYPSYDIGAGEGRPAPPFDPPVRPCRVSWRRRPGRPPGPGAGGPPRRRLRGRGHGTGAARPGPAPGTREMSPGPSPPATTDRRGPGGPDSWNSSPGAADAGPLEPTRCPYLARLSPSGLISSKGKDHDLPGSLSHDSGGV